MQEGMGAAAAGAGYNATIVGVATSGPDPKVSARQEDDEAAGAGQKREEVDGRKLKEWGERRRKSTEAGEVLKPLRAEGRPESSFHRASDALPDAYNGLHLLEGHERS